MTARKNAMMHLVAEELSRLLGEPIEWKNVRDRVENPLGEVGFFAWKGKTTKRFALRDF